MCLLSLKNMQTSFIKGQCSEVSQVSTLKLLPDLQSMLRNKISVSLPFEERKLKSKIQFTMYHKEGGFSEEIYLVFSIIYQVKSLIKP